jgi:hypothetical protein
MKPLFSAAKAAPRRVVYAEGEDERVLRAAQIVVDEGLAKPILIGRPQVVEQRLQRLGLRARPGREFELINPESDPRYRDYWSTYHRLTERKGVTPDFARVEMRRTSTLIAAMGIYKGEADSLLCGTSGAFAMHLHFIDAVIGPAAGAARLRGHERAADAGPHGVHLRHLREPGPRRRPDRRDDAARRRGDQALRHRAEGGAALGVELRLAQDRLGREDAPGARAHRAARAPSSRSRARCTATPRSRR